MEQIKIDSPRCDIRGCRNEPTLGIHEKNGYRYLCDKHRPDKRKEYQRDANWRHRLKVKYGIVMPRQSYPSRSSSGTLQGDNLLKPTADTDIKEG